MKPSPMKPYEAQGFDEDERENLRSWGVEVPEPPEPPPSPEPREMEHTAGVFHCPDCRVVLSPPLERMGTKYIRIPEDWTDDEVRAAANFILRQRVATMKGGAGHGHHVDRYEAGNYGDHADTGLGWEAAATESSPEPREGHVDDDTTAYQIIVQGLRVDKETAHRLMDAGKISKGVGYGCAECGGAT